MSVEHDVALCDVKLLARRDAQLLLDEVDAGDGLGDRVLDLQPRVHLDEEEVRRAVSRHEELHGPGTPVVDGCRGRDGGGTETRAQRRVDGGRRGLLDDLLVAPLQRALPLPQMDDRPVGVGEHLHLDVARSGHQPLEQERVVTEGGPGHAPGGLERCGEGRGIRHDLHALAAAARGGLHEQREPDVGRARGDLVVAERRRTEAGNDRHAVRGDVIARTDLVGHDLERALARPDEDDAGGRARRTERGTLGQEPVAGVHGLRARDLRGRDQRVDAQVAARGGGLADAHRLVGLAHVRRAGVRVAVDGDRPDAEAPQRADHPAGDLAAVRDQHGVEEGHVAHIRKSPKAGAGSGVREATSRASPSRSRVSSGSTMPSSQSRAVA
ncbi:hypothetical protein RR49_00277 [Microbacterium ginsengisoli]|uniref:Uncharacterized protein n=1 Tax=Microbacterium ginsengisoli TaxID=400772 RepID=A0A0F0M0Q4_9MICO|nr:hypothetical protein RR49_00277 [Microbacterium ginsengisoli]